MIIIFGRTFTQIVKTYVLDIYPPDSKNTIFIKSEALNTNDKINSFMVLFVRSKEDDVEMKLESFSLNIDKD